MMNWNNEQLDEQLQENMNSHAYTGYTGASGQSSQMFEQPAQQQQYTFHQPASQSMHGPEQAPYGYPPAFSPAPASIDGRHLAGALSYSFCWFSGLLFLLFAGENRYIRFHALQSIAFFGAINLIDVGVFATLARFRGFHSPGLILLSLFFLFILNFIGFIGWLVAIIQASRGLYYKLPFVGKAVEKSVGGNHSLK